VEFVRYEEPVDSFGATMFKQPEENDKKCVLSEPEKTQVESVICLIRELLSC